MVLDSGISETSRVWKCERAAERPEQQPQRRSPRELRPVSLLEVTARGLRHGQPKAEEGLA